MADRHEALSDDRSRDFSRENALNDLNNFEKLELLLLQTLEIVMKYDENDDLAILENCLSVVDQVRGELTFLRARIYKEIFRRKFASVI
ncbi:hypothetical protein JXL21_06465 [Candidatus Bathyarchaeota archaeon]|nr:hypothetical protein [Candidatus Bathyarchaeota archaeon]